MNTAVKVVPKSVDNIPFQEASLDIWDKKYRLASKEGKALDQSMDDTYKRVARTLADVERPAVREQWHERFLWALRKGAIPAGRIISNAGAWEHKPATSTINCTVSGRSSCASPYSRSRSGSARPANNGKRRRNSTLIRRRSRPHSTSASLRRAGTIG